MDLKGRGTRLLVTHIIQYNILTNLMYSLPTYVFVTEESKKKKDKKEKDSEKPDTFLEKLIVHLTKNMQVSNSIGNDVDH